MHILYNGKGRISELKLIIQNIFTYRVREIMFFNLYLKLMRSFSSDLSGGFNTLYDFTVNFKFYLVLFSCMSTLDFYLRIIQ